MATKPTKLTPGMAMPCGSDTMPSKAVEGTNLDVKSLAFATGEAVCWQFNNAPTYNGTGDATVTVSWYAENATSGDCVWGVSMACVTPNTDGAAITAKAFGTQTTVADTHLGTTSKRLHRATVTFPAANLNSLTTADDWWIRLERVASGDTMSNEAHFTGGEISWEDS